MPKQFLSRDDKAHEKRESSNIVSLFINILKAIVDCRSGLETFRSEDEDDYEHEFDLKFFAYSQNIYFPESFILPFFTRKVSTVNLSERGYSLSRLQNDN